MITLPAVKRLLRWTAALLLLCAGTLHASTPEAWRNGAYAYSADNTPLSIILEDFTNSFGVDINLGTLPDSNVTGRLRAVSPEAFLNRLALEYRFQWFVYNNTLYVSPLAAQTSRRLEISPDAAPDIKQALKGIGLLEPRFGWGELPDEGVVLVTGPPEYVNLIADFAKKSDTPKEDKEPKEMMAFPLKYASVADRNIRYRDQTLLVPGVATMLNELLGQSGGDSAKGMSSGQGGEDGMEQMRMESQGILNQLVGRGSHGNSHSDGGAPASVMAGRVSADVRNNALLVRDDPKYRSAYQSLIATIDVPQKLIEIDALIVDIDRSELARLSTSWAGQFGNVTGGSTLFSGPSTLFVTDFRRFFADIQALEGEGTASIIANPSIMTLENQPAVIDFSDTAFIRAIGERVADIQAVTAGTSLRVTPRAIGSVKSSVQLIVDVEDGKLDKNDDGEAEGTSNGVISTQALVQERRSLVMGGFHTKQSGDRERRIPILGSIPLIGKLFTSTQHETSQRERLFIITPHLVGDQVDPSRYIAEENRSQLNDAMGDVNRRHKYTDMKSLVETALRDLAENRLPTGFSTGGSGQTLSALCRLPGGLFNDYRRHQWYHSSSVQLTVGVITNNSNVTQRFDEATCRSDRTLAVAVWPRSQLRPGESAEVYVAFEPGAVARPGRVSLLSSTATATGSRLLR